jgi:ribosomal protein L29
VAIVKGVVSVSELREKSDAELLGRKVELEREMFAIRSTVATGSEKEKAGTIPQKRKEKARILTIIRERELKQELREPLL